MKRITSTLLIAAIPTLATLPAWAPGPGTAGSGTGSTWAPGQQQDGSQAGSQDDSDDWDATDQDEQGDGPPNATGEKDASELDVFGRRTKVVANTFEERVQGGWRLTQLQLGALSARGRQAQGFLHVGPSFLSMELHALWGENAGEDAPPNDVHTSFTADYQLDDSGKLFCSTIIGSFIDDDTSELRWERTGFERQFTVREIINGLELTFKDETGAQSRLVFAPFVARNKGRRDIFGRKEIGSYGAKDIYGRPEASRQGQRDIFGRPVGVDPVDGEPAGKGEPKKDESQQPR